MSFSIILANTEELHNRIMTLCNRIRDLENALETLQKSVSTQPHPLLREDQLNIKIDLPPPANPSATTDSSSGRCSSLRVFHEGLDPMMSSKGDEALVDAFGMLEIGPHGETNYLGQTARSEHLLRALSKSVTLAPAPPPRLSPRIVEFSLSDSSGTNIDIGREIYGYLPPLSEAIQLCEMYVSHAAYLTISLPRTELIDDVLETVYRAGAFEHLRDAHNLSLLFGVFAIALILDPTKKNPWSVRARECYHLARAVLGIISPLKKASLAAIQALLHLSSYLELSDWEGTGPNQGWLHIGTAVRLAYGIGLHLNSKRWNVWDPEAKRRHRLFWQLFVQETWISFFLGRPPTMSVELTDCPYPQDEVVGQDGQKEMSYLTWASQYSLLLHDVMGVSLHSKPYATILALDRRIRDFYVPPSLKTVFGAPAGVESSKLMSQLLCLIVKESSLLNLHRPYFTQALHDQPGDLDTHQYIPSVIATYRSAWRVIRSLALAWRDQGPSVARIGCAWSPALSAALILCVLVIRAPSSRMTASALEELEVVSQLFQDAASSSRFAQSMSGAVMMLKRKAQTAVAGNSDIFSPEVCIVTPADLDSLSGRTHLVAHPLPHSTGFTELSAATTSESSPIHPTVAEDMRSFGVAEPSQFYVGDMDTPADVNTPAELPGTDYGPISDFADFSATFPALDATWQSFVENLGF
ncbi:unnamed protein product [Mycena citricolor]|uniref:Xylanolytic transcriptional activator regulatory domain-containing protein n=1 Tax=Mycena citricolor TaxID=2018698 RepID=A0AAD2H4X8_9AGAR|nr:unnamed protein product [Mycena citricolor]